MDPRLVEMGSLGALLDAPEPPGWTVSGLREGAAWAGRPAWPGCCGRAGPTARLRKGTLAKGTLSRLGRAGVLEENIIKGTNLTRPRTEHFRA